MTVKAAAQPMNYISRITLLHEIRSDLEQLEVGLSPAVQWREGSLNQGSYATGVRESNLPQLQLSSFS